MDRSDKAPNANASDQARASVSKTKRGKTAPGQEKVRLYQNEAGDIVSATKEDWKNTLRDQGFRPFEEPEVAEDAPSGGGSAELS